MSTDRPDIALHRHAYTGDLSPSDHLIHRIFESRAKALPQAAAVIWNEQETTYSQLNDLANRVAHALLKCCIGPDDRVGIFAERSKDSVVGMLAILKAGGAYVPLDPCYPTDRLNFMIEDSSPVAVITSSTLAHRLSQINIPVVLLDADLPRQTESPPATATKPHHLAYVIYTSGSTGRPKGVMVEHRNVLSLIEGTSYAPIRAEDCLAHCASPSFDATTWEVWAALLNGARLLVVPQCTVLDPASFNRTLVKHQVTAMWLTVGLFNEYVDALEHAFGGLRYLLIGGDALVPSIVSRALTKPKPPQHLINGYGPTETTTFATTYEVTSIPESAPSIPIGRPIANARVYLLDEDRHPVPSGHTGEIYIGGSGVSRGYLNEKDQTDARFLADPYESAFGARMYRSGDLGRWRFDGNIEFLGRNDSQVKIRGFRVEPREVELALQQFPAVERAVVVVREERPGAKRLIAYVVPERRTLDGLLQGSEGSLSSEASHLVVRVRKHLKDTLPDHMIPAIVVPMRDLPLTSNGKVDRDALPPPDGREQLSQVYAAARTSIEETLCNIWMDELKVARVGIDDNFFELGGDSLMGIQMIGRVSSDLRLEFHFMAVFQYPTIRELAQYIDESVTRRSSASGQTAPSG